MKKIAIIDYGMCNLDSVARAVEKCGGMPIVTADSAALVDATGIVLPGVGAFHDAMDNLAERGLIVTLQQQVRSGTPFLGICLGMQLMAERGFEGGESQGLGLLPGDVARFIQDAPSTRIPHVGWNGVEQVTTSPLFEGISNGADFYFVHSYHFRCEERYVLGRTDYCGGFNSVVGHGLCFGVQFHPEKSLGAGMAILRNFLKLC